MATTSTSTELSRFMSFLVEQVNDATEPMTVQRVFTQFSQLGAGVHSEDYYVRRFHRKLAPKMARWDNFSIEARVRLMFGLDGKVADDFLRQIRIYGAVQLDENRRICHFTSHDGQVKLESTELTELKQQVKEKIGTDDADSLQITDLRTVFEAFFVGITKDYLLKFNFILLGLDCSEFRELQQTVERKINEPEIANKVLLISDIHRVVQGLLSFISH
ncbi:SPK domain-containing protein [Caenorhabditis elegans]|uniref:SPK domain-containing protein n=1 Tax=Caenorhabditis elegans TaxID=6239 RepID=A0A8D9I8M7_CAEEL|nr:SPK domain-containing protein [Caenorhabditis elegans]CAG8860258.1 SPK domain-containing protein [Caenorhabditis elegans]